MSPSLEALTHQMGFVLQNQGQHLNIKHLLVQVIILDLLSGRFKGWVSSGHR